ncbi:TOMM system kinase/cyclase fusion protein [Hyalangium minutum]|uniref:Adenylate cyclase n=1 Tax=Hyalangium minutum TaxID=394096 RepID=A0A085W3Q1_9BACT|nr:TOMM system kinase/cyclase fusion protein [Hyalangium minutum]KFE62314.1 Adenylate cyclase [Hyalangium minutum]
MASIAAGTVFQERYEILSPLGEGGFGQVYRARHRSTNQDVAIKLLKTAHLEDEHHVARFRREMQLCARLYHPHIVRLIDSGVTADNQLYSVFEYVPGRSLAEVVAQGPIAAEEATHLMLQVLDALGAAHKLGIIHRDLKPQNIMVAMTGVRRNALVLDFGLGTLPQEAMMGGAAPLTRSREVLGTPAYAAPEQLRSELVTERTDLYAWGLTFLECLTGQRAMSGATLQEVLYKQLGPDPIPFPDWLERHRLGPLLRKVTQKDPKAREVTAQGLIQELESRAREGGGSGAPQMGAGMGAGQALVETVIMKADGEHRQLTAVCIGVTLAGLEEREDVEEADQLHRGLYVALAEIARRLEAHVGGVLAERMVVFMGYPTAREDDARRAARMALEMVSELEQRAQELAEKHGASLEVRVGIHTGLVVSPSVLGGSSALSSAPVGPVPSVASRLAERASPGAILVSTQTAKLLRDAFELMPAQEAQAGSWSMQSFELGPELRTASHGQVAPLFGRLWETELLRQRWRQVVAGVGQALLITGEPGIGKSRLAQELAQQARDVPHTFLECRCSPEWRHSTLRPVVDLLERLLGLDRGSTPEQAVAALEALLLRYGFVLAEFLPLFAALLSLKDPSGRYPPPPMSPQRQKEETFQALLGLLFEMAQQQPVLLLVEDLHWADPTTLELLGQLVGDVSGARLCALLTARPEFTPPGSASQVLQVQLGRLERSQVEEMVKRLTQGVLLSAEVVERILERTDGVPLFVEELTRMVVESLSRQGDTPRKVGSLEVPSTLRDLLMARLDRLGVAKATAQLASALGRDFSYEVLLAASASDEAMLKKDLEALVVADLVHRRRGARGSGYAFKHALIRDTAYEAMPKQMRRQMHARIAAALEQRFPELVQQRPDVLARHHAGAEQKREALGYALKAAVGALMRSAHAEALSHATEALEWLGAISDERERAKVELEFNEVITPALMATRGWTDAAVKAHVERSQALIDLLGDSPRVVPTLWALASYHHLRAQHTQARALAERLVSMEGLTQHASHQAVTLPLLGDSLCAQGLFVESGECLGRALSLREDAVPSAASMYALDPRVQAMLSLGFVRWHLGFPDEGLRVMESALARARDLNHMSTRAVASIYTLVLYHLRLEFARLDTLSSELVELTTRQRLVSQGAYAQLLRCVATRDLQGMQRILALLEEHGSALYWSSYASIVAEVESSLGHHEAALQRLEEALRRAQASGEGFSQLHVLYRYGNALLAQNPDSNEGEAKLREAIALARERSARMVELRAAVPLCKQLLRKGQHAEARELLMPLYGQFTEGFDTLDLQRARAVMEEWGS